MDSKRNHFISVSRAGVLMARRANEPPVAIATSSEGLEIAVPGERMEAASIRVFFEHHRGAARLRVYVTDVEVAGNRMPVAEFLESSGVTESELGRWMRDAVERALDARAGAGVDPLQGSSTRLRPR